MYGIRIYTVDPEEIINTDLNEDMMEEIYYLQNDSVYIVLRLFEVWYKDLDLNDGKLIEIKGFYKAKKNFTQDNIIMNDIIEYLETEENIKYRIGQIEEFFEYAEEYIKENKIEYLYIKTDYFM